MSTPPPHNPVPPEREFSLTSVHLVSMKHQKTTYNRNVCQSSQGCCEISEVFSSKAFIAVFLRVLSALSAELSIGL